ncbi:MAG: DUF2225 domain-containing protein [Clostridiales bacterium]|nr:DUF2225 domain-containing protein [Clostridiales bacterium]
MTKKQSDKKIKLEDYVYLREFECPLCFTSFKNTFVKTTKVHLVKTDTDLKPSYEPVDPLYYDIISCPSCGYSAMKTHFKYISDKQHDILMKEFINSCKPQQYPLIYSMEQAVERYKLALFCATKKRVKNSEKAMLCLKLSWLMRDAGLEFQEKGFEEHAYNGFLQAYQTEYFPMFGMNELALTYLLGDLARRLGNLDVAMRYISTVLTSKSVELKLKERAQKVRNLIKAAREKETNEE